ncbi:hypothetical protein P261_02632 [Lachnospiraceae bacterium TWA4]|nr:hypothetical protein P261_02632 [Lachnospiraceae bacterium TWA4]
MSNEQFKYEKLYQITMAIAKKLYQDQLISKEEYCQIDTIFKKKYQSTLGTLFTDIDLL